MLEAFNRARNLDLLLCWCAVLDCMLHTKDGTQRIVSAEENGQLGYMIRLESSDAANLSAEAVALGYRSGEGISPGRLLRTAQALARAIMITLSSISPSYSSFTSSILLELTHS